MRILVFLKRQYLLIKTIKQYSAKYVYFSISIKIINIANVYLSLYIGKYTMNILSDAILQRNTNMKSVIFVLVCCCIIELLTLFVLNFFHFHIGKVKLKLDDDLLIELTKKVSEFDISYYDDAFFYNQISYARKYKSVIVDNFNSLLEMIFSIISFILALIVSIKFNIYISIFAIAIVLPSMFIHKNINIQQFVTEKDMTSQLRFTDYLISLFYNKHTEMEMQLYGFQSYIMEKIKNNQVYIRNTRLLLNLRKAFFESGIIIFEKITGIIQVIFVLVTIIKKGFMIGDYTYYTGILQQLTVATKMIIYQINNIHTNTIKYDEYINLVNKKSILENKGVKKINIADVTSIEFRHVHFKYPNTEKNVLNDLSFIIKMGEKVALVGENGAGKSTILKLLMRYYDPTSGGIFLNGVDIREYDINSYRALFSSMFQDSVSYLLTLRENITISNIYLNDDPKRMEQLIDDLGLNDIYSDFDLERYYGKEFQNDGYILSKGQQQKLHAARTLYRHGAVYILDEPAASLDAKNEERFIKTLEKYTREKMVIYVTHRYNNIRDMDNIIVLQNGHVIEEGRHNELLNLKGVYSMMFSLQEVHPE